MHAHRSQQPAQTRADDSLPHLPLYNRRVLTQEEVMSPRNTSPAKRSAMESASPVRSSKTTTCGEAASNRLKKDGETTASIVSPVNKRQKTDHIMLASPPTMPDLGIPQEDKGAKPDDSDSQVVDLTTTAESNDTQQDNSVCESCVNEEIEMAQVLSNMNKSASTQFAVSNI